MDRLQIFSGNAHPQLANNICQYLGMPLGQSNLTKFPDMETRIRINEDVRGNDVFVIQPTCTPANDHLLELLIFIDSLRRASASRITAVIPYYGYARQDRKDEGRVPITAKLVANILVEAGANRVLTVDLHAAQIQGFFDIPVDHMAAQPVLLKYLIEKDIKDLVVSSTDIGGSKVALSYAKKMDAELALIEKRRQGPGQTEVGNVIGSVKDRNVLLVDDMISTGGSLVEAAKVLKSSGAKDIYVAVTHAIFCGPAIERINNFDFREVVVTDTIPLDTSKFTTPITVLSLANLLGEAIRRIHFHQSISVLFKSFSAR